MGENAAAMWSGHKAVIVGPTSGRLASKTGKAESELQNNHKQGDNTRVRRYPLLSVASQETRPSVSVAIGIRWRRLRRRRPAVQERSGSGIHRTGVGGPMNMV